MTIIQLMNNYTNGKDMPQRIKYFMMMDGYQYFKWDNDESEYICETDEHCFLQVPWHHLLDEIEIIK